MRVCKFYINRYISTIHVDLTHLTYTYNNKSIMTGDQQSAAHSIPQVSSCIILTILNLPKPHLVNESHCAL